eukprot:c24630_g1_i2 orf=156-1160(+)
MRKCHGMPQKPRNVFVVPMGRSRDENEVNRKKIHGEVSNLHVVGLRNLTTEFNLSKALCISRRRTMEMAPLSYMEVNQPPAKKAKNTRVRYPNWEKHETIVLVKAYKRQMDEYNASANNKGRMGTIEQKWERISSLCAKDGVVRDDEQCRKRWQDLSKKYKKIKDWEESNGQESYWLISSNVRKDKNLPSSFDREIYDTIDSFMGSRPLMIVQGIFGGTAAGIDLQEDHDVPSSSHDGPSNIVQVHADQDSLGEPSFQEGSWALFKEHTYPVKRHNRNSQADSGSDRLAEALENATRLAQEQFSAHMTEVLADTLTKIADAIKMVAESMRRGSR